MPEFVSVRQHPESKTVVTVTKERAKAKSLDTLAQPAVDNRGRPLGPRPLTESSTDDLKGKALDEAVKAANDAGAEIASTLSADEKRSRLAEFRATQEV